MSDHFHQYTIRDVIVTKHFHREMPGFDTRIVTDCGSENCTHLHKYEENIEGNHVFRGLIDHVHIVYAISRDHDIIFLRALRNFKEYKKYLDDRREVEKEILAAIAEKSSG